MQEIEVPREALVEALLDQMSLRGVSWSAGYAVWVLPDGKATVANRGERTAIRQLAADVRDGIEPPDRLIALILSWRKRNGAHFS